MKKIVSVLLVIILIACIFTGCSGGAVKKSDIKIGLAAPSVTHGWVAGVSYYAEKYCKENGVEYELTTSESPAAMGESLDELSEKGVQAVVVWPQWIGTEKAVKKLVEKNIPVVSFDFDINCDGIYKITGNNYDMGYQCAKYITKRVGKDASVAVFDVPSAGSVSALRKKGFYDYLKEKNCSTESIFEITEEGFSRDSGYKDMKIVLENHKKIDAVFSMDDEVSIGIVKAIAESGRTDIKAVTGGGGMQEYFNMIGDSQYADLGLASALYSPSMIEDAIKTAIDLCSGKKSNKVVVIPTKMVDSDNVKEYIDAENTVY